MMTKPPIRIGWAVNLYSDSFEGQHETGEDEEEAKVKGGKFSKVFACAVGVVGGVFPEGNKACEGGNKRAYAADIYAEQKLWIVPRKLGHKYGGGDVAYHLAGKCRHKQGIFFKEGRKSIPYGGDPCHVSGKDKKEYKGQQKAVVHAF